MLLDAEAWSVRLESRHLPPSLNHPFGTDWLGRDMLARTIKGLSLSIGVGLAAAAASSVIALLLGLAAGLKGGHLDRAITWLIDMCLSVPHLVTLILIAFVLGGGTRGVIIGIALTHWPGLTRVIRAEVLQLTTAEYVQVSRHLGRSHWWIASRHMLPHLLSQLTAGLLVTFPHAILHESAITFLGLGLSAEQPAIGVMLAESMSFLSAGMWWLAVFPGLGLLLVVLCFDAMARTLRLLIDPHRAHD